MNRNLATFSLLSPILQNRLYKSSGRHQLDSDGFPPFLAGVSRRKNPNKHMASAVLPCRNEAHWDDHKVYLRKFSNHNTKNNYPRQFSSSSCNPNPGPNLNPKPNYNPSSTNRLLNQSPTHNNPNPGGHVHNSSSRTQVRQNDEPLPRYSVPPVAASSNCSVHVKNESSQGAHVTFHLGSYSRRDLKELKNRFISELERIRMLRYQIETRELEFKSNHSVCPPPLLFNSSIAAADSATPPKMIKKKIAGTLPGGNYKILGQKRALPLSSGGEYRHPTNAAVLHSMATRKVERAMMRRCVQILAKLMKHKHGWVFNKPVDTVSLGLHNYHEVIKHPVDLGTVKSKLGKHIYGWPLDFASDVRLTFENALTYNPKGDDAHTMATVLLNMFEEMFNPAYKKFESEHQRIIAAQQNLRKPLPDLMQLKDGQSQQDVKKPQPDLMHSQAALSDWPLKIQSPPLVAPTKPVVLQQRKLPKPKVKASNKREMSNEEREKLGLSLQILPVESIDEMLQIVMKRNPKLAAAGGNGEVELDIQALDSETMWELDGYVNLHMKAAVNKMKRAELISSSTPVLQINEQSPVVELMIQEAAAPSVHKAEVDVDIDDAMPVINYPPLEIEKDTAPSPAINGRSSSSSSSSSGSDSSSSSDSESSSGTESDADSVHPPHAGLGKSRCVIGNP